MRNGGGGRPLNSVVRAHLVTLRCTKKLLRRVGAVSPSSVKTPTTRLGDWHANLYLWRPQLIHCMNDRSTLSVLLAAKDSASFPVRLRVALSRLLLRLGAPRNAVEAEVAAMEEFSLAPTN